MVTVNNDFNTKNIENSTNYKGFFIYYLILLLILVFRTSDAEPDILYRFVYLLAFFIPLLIKFRTFYPACLICFTTIGLNGFAYSVFPYMMYIYLIISLFGIFISRNNNFNINPLFLFVFGYILIVNYFNSFTIPNIVYSLGIIICLGFYLNKKSYKTLFFCFCIISLFLSLIYLLNYETFVHEYGPGDEELERAGWTDPNYFSCIIGMGVVSSFYLLISSKKSKMIEKTFWIITICLSILVQILMASRGGVIAVSSSIIFLILTSNKNWYLKILIIALSGLYIYWIYNNGYFELLEYRFENDSGGGSNRTFIWEERLNEFNNFNFLEFLFGVGYERSYTLGSIFLGSGFHNDFIAILCQYGILGLFIFIYILVLPIIKCHQKLRFGIIGLIIYLTATCLTLEPITSGRLVYFGFYFMIYIFAIQKTSIISNNTTISYENQ